VADRDSILGLSPEHNAFRNEISSFAERVLEPARAESPPGDYIPRLLPALSECGLLGLLVAEEKGGCGGDAMCVVLTMEEIGAVDAGLAGALSFHYLCSRALDGVTDTPFSLQSLQSMSRGEALGALAMTEPGAGSNPVELTCSAVEDRGGWRLNGNKCFVCNVGAASMTFILLLARETNGGLTCFLAPYPLDGITLIHRYVYLGWDTIHSWAVVLSNCVIPGDQIIGQRGEGLSFLNDSLCWGRMAMAAGALGLSRTCCRLSINYARERRQFSQPIIHNQAVLFRIADMDLRIEVGRTSLWRAVSLNEPPNDKADMLYIFCGECAEFCSSAAMEIHGGLGYTVEGPVARLYRDAKGFKLALGTADLARIRISQAL